MTIHPKASGAALGAALGTVIVGVLASISGIHLTAEANAAIPAFLSTLGAFLAPDGGTPTTVQPPVPPPEPAPAPAPVPPPPANAGT